MNPKRLKKNNDIWDLILTKGLQGLEDDDLR